MKQPFDTQTKTGVMVANKNRDVPYMIVLTKEFADLLERHKLDWNCEASEAIIRVLSEHDLTNSRNRSWLAD
jgi:hypothetical protein